MASIFINYRRDDAPGAAGRLFDHLALKFSRRTLFMDVDAMTPGMDFAEQLDAQVSQCDALLAVIGPHWLDAKDQNGLRRLDSDKDYVRIELAAALKRAIPVIPVLVDGAAMPPEDRLSDDLKPLARRHALELRHTRFNADADAITHALETLVPTRHRGRRHLVAVALGIAASVAVIIALLWPKLIAKLHPVAPLPVATTTTPPAPSPPNGALPQPPAPPAAPPRQATLPPVPATQPGQPQSMPAPASAPAATGLPPGVKLGEMLRGISLPGAVYRFINMPQGDPAACQAACRADDHCVAWTLGKGPGGGTRCGLHPLIPDQVSNPCCTSGIEREPPPEMREPPAVPAGMVGAMRGVDFLGGDYRGFGGADVTPQICQATCKAETMCVAWTYVRAGIFGSNPHCWLKGRMSPRVDSPCCIAGVERNQAK